MSTPESTPNHVRWESGNPMPESTLTLCQRRLYPQPGTKNLASELGLRQIWVCPRIESQVRRQDRELARKGFWKLNALRHWAAAQLLEDQSIFILRCWWDDRWKLLVAFAKTTGTFIYSVQLHQTINHSAKLNKTKTLLYEKAGNRTWAGRQSHCICWNSTWHFFDFFCSSA